VPQTGCWCSLSRRRGSWWRWRIGNLILSRLAPPDQIRALGGYAVAATTVGAGDLPHPAAAAAVVVLAGRSRRLVVTEYVWDVGAMIPVCWPQHPHLVYEIAVLADQRRRAGHALTSDALEECRYNLPAFTERIKSRLRNDCEGRPPAATGERPLHPAYGRDQPPHPGGSLCGGTSVL
jgi:hypothetical protein